MLPLPISWLGPEGTGATYITLRQALPSRLRRTYASRRPSGRIWGSASVGMLRMASTVHGCAARIGPPHAAAIASRLYQNFLNRSAVVDIQSFLAGHIEFPSGADK